jgi:multiple sugar transport system substrate-binding protein/putative aldouronate transport system substrate-binding protein
LAGTVAATQVFAGPKDIPASVIPKETVTLQVFDQLANYSGLQAGWFADVMLKKFNVKLNIISQPPNSGILQTRMESGNLGDLVVWGNDQEDYVNAYKANMLFNWDDEKLLDNYGPYVKATMPFALEKNRKISGGKLYGFGYDVSASSKDRQEFFYNWDLRFDLYEKLGKPRIKNLDDLVGVLEQMKKICPKDDNGNPTYGASFFNDWDGNMVMYVKSTATAYYGFDEFDFGLYDPSTQKYHDALETGGPYLTCLKFYNKLYQKGLLDPDSQTQKYDGMNEDFKNGTAFFNIFNWMGSGTYNTEAHQAAGKAMFPVAPEAATPICYGQSVYGGNRIWSIGADTKYPELCMAIINWLSTPEGSITMQWGPKGVTWDYDKNNKSILTELGKLTTKDPNQPMSAPYTGTFKDGQSQINNTTWQPTAINPETKEPYIWRKWASYKAEPKSDIEKSWRAWAKASSADEYLGNRKYVLSPGTMFSEDPIPETLKVKWNQVADAIKNNTWKAIYAKTDAEYNAIVANMVKEANSYGFADCLAFTKTQVARRAAAEDAVKAK